MKNPKIDCLDNWLKPLFKEALINSIFTGAAVGILKRYDGSSERFIRTYGRTRNDEKGRPVNKNTFFDLASLTKPLCTTLSILCLIDRGILDWNDTLARLLKYETGEEKGNIQINQLLSHSSGLKAYKPYFKRFTAVQKMDNKKNYFNICLKSLWLILRGVHVYIVILVS